MHTCTTLNNIYSSFQSLFEALPRIIEKLKVVFEFLTIFPKQTMIFFYKVKDFLPQADAGQFST